MTPENVIRTCEECGREIPRKRIEAAPNATLCVACQEAADVRINANSRVVRNALVERSEWDGEMFAPEAHE